jgi:hypothetical protein
MNNIYLPIKHFIMNLNDFLKFFADILARFISPTPKFFKIMQIIVTVITVLIGLPAFLEDTGVAIPEAWEAISSSIVFYGGLIILFISQLTVTAESKPKLSLKD